ncbi:MAG: Bax inhibitor-1 family protein [Candidatus Sericytochromatia bacterium]
MSSEMDRIRHLGETQPQTWGAMSKLTFTTKVMPVFGLGLLMTAFGVFAGIQVAATYGMMPLYIIMALEFVMVLTSGAWQHKEGLNKFLFFVYALFSGMTLVPLLSFVMASGGIAMIGQALTVTTITFGGLMFYGMTTKRDFTSLGGFLFIGALALIAAGLLNAFVFQSGMMGMVVSVISVGLFSAYTVYQMSVIRQHYSDQDYIGAALGLFIGFIGLFTSILRLFGFMGNSDD